MAEDEEWERVIAASIAQKRSDDDDDDQQFQRDTENAMKASLGCKNSDNSGSDPHAHDGGDDDDCKPSSNKRPRNKKTYGDERDSLVMESMPSSPSPPNCLHLALVSRASDDTPAEDGCQLQLIKMNMFANALRAPPYNIHVNIHLEAEFQLVNRRNGGIQSSKHFEELIKELERIDKEIDGDLVVMANEILRFALDKRGIVDLEARLKRINPNTRLETLKEMGQSKQPAAHANEEKDRQNRATEKNTNHMDALENLPINGECLDTFNSIAAKKIEIKDILSSKSGAKDQWMKNVVQQPPNTVGNGLPTNQAFLQDPRNFSGLSSDEMVDKWIEVVEDSGAPPGTFGSLMWMRESEEDDTRRKIGENNWLQDQLEYNLAAMDVIEGIDCTSVGIQQSCGKRDVVNLEMTRVFEIIALPGPLRNIIATSPNRFFQEKPHLKVLFYGLLRRGDITPLFSKYFGRVRKLSDTKPTSWDIANLSFELETEKRGEFKKSKEQKKKATASIPVELNYGPFARLSDETIRKIVYVANKLSTKTRKDLLAHLDEDDKECSVDEDDERKMPAKRNGKKRDTTKEKN